MALDRVRGPPDIERLVFVAGGAGETHRALGQVERVGVKLEHLDVEREGPEDRVAARGLAEEDRIDAELGLRPAEHSRAERGRQQLGSQANAEVRTSRRDGLADRPLLRHEPRVRVLLVDAHRPSHDHEQVVLAPVGKRFPEVETNTMDLDPAAEKHVTVDAHGIRMVMLERQCTHGGQSIGRGGRARLSPERSLGMALHRPAKSTSLCPFSGSVSTRLSFTQTSAPARRWSVRRLAPQARLPT